MKRKRKRPSKKKRSHKRKKLRRRNRLLRKSQQAKKNRRKRRPQRKHQLKKRRRLKKRRSPLPNLRLKKKLLQPKRKRVRSSSRPRNPKLPCRRQDPEPLLCDLMAKRLKSLISTMMKKSQDNKTPKWSSQLLPTLWTMMLTKMSDAAVSVRFLHVVYDWISNI